MKSLTDQLVMLLEIVCSIYLYFVMKVDETMARQSVFLRSSLALRLPISTSVIKTMIYFVVSANNASSLWPFSYVD